LLVGLNVGISILCGFVVCLELILLIGGCLSDKDLFYQIKRAFQVGLHFSLIKLTAFHMKNKQFAIFLSKTFISPFFPHDIDTIGKEPLTFLPILLNKPVSELD